MKVLPIDRDCFDWSKKQDWKTQRTVCICVLCSCRHVVDMNVSRHSCTRAFHSSFESDRNTETREKRTWTNVCSKHDDTHTCIHCDHYRTLWIMIPWFMNQISCNKRCREKPASSLTDFPPTKQNFLALKTLKPWARLPAGAGENKLSTEEARTYIVEGSREAASSLATTTSLVVCAARCARVWRGECRSRKFLRLKISASTSSEKDLVRQPLVESRPLETPDSWAL
jgi:hypothetical protein